MATKSAALRNSQRGHLITEIDTLDILDGPVASGNVLVSFSITLVADTPDGVLTVSGLPLTQAAIAGGVGTHARLKKAADATKTIDDLTVTATGGGGQVELSNTNIANGQNVNLTAATYTIGATV